MTARGRASGLGIDMNGYDALAPYIGGAMTLEEQLHIIEDMPQRCARWQAMAAAAKAELEQARDAARHAELIFKRLGDECMAAVRK